jgi:transcriptional regulator with XRE-family HTH domain
MSRRQPRLRAVLGARLRALRRARGLSQARLGRLSGLSGKFVGEVERGVKSISADSLALVSGALQLPIHELLNIDGHPLDRRLEELMALVRRHPAKASKILAVTRALVGAA